MYHGIIIDLQFKNPQFPETLKVFAKRKSKINPWTIYGIEVEDTDLANTITVIQQNMLSDKPYYAHFYNDKDLIVIFQNKVFNVTPHKQSWDIITKYGKELNIPTDQLDFWPNRFQDEIHYFDKDDFVMPNN